MRIGGSVVAEIKPSSGDSSEAKYLLSDHLGSPHLLTGEDGQILEELSFTAFGKRRNAQWTSNDPVGPALSTISYTGHEADEDIGLINMRGRQYDPKLGQFIQPDPIVQAPDYSQSWNRYAYVFNNPLKFVDPTGYETTGSGGDGSGSGSEGDGSEGRIAYDGSNTFEGAPVLGLSITITSRVPANQSRSENPATPTQSANQNAADSKSLDTGDPGTDAPGNNDNAQGAPDLSRQELMAIPNGAQAPPVNHELLNEALPQIPDTHEDFDTAAGVIFQIATAPIGPIGHGIKLGWGIFRAGKAGIAAARAAAARAAAKAAARKAASATVARGVARPTVTDPKLANLVKDLYKGANTSRPIGTGSTADAIRHEAATGQAVGGKFHTQKGTEYARALENWLGKNPGAAASDRSAAQAILNDLRSALNGK